MSIGQAAGMDAGVDLVWIRRHSGPTDGPDCCSTFFFSFSLLFSFFYPMHTAEKCYNTKMFNPFKLYTWPHHPSSI
jgi:hypothetical protein